MSKLIANMWDIEADADWGVWLHEWPNGHGARMSAEGARELARALLAAADESDASSPSGEEDER